jgi:hypothetical protein
MSKLLRNDAAWEIVDLPFKHQSETSREALLASS